MTLGINLFIHVKNFYYTSYVSFTIPGFFLALNTAKICDPLYFKPFSYLT